MTDAQFNQIISELHNLQNICATDHSYLHFIQENIFAITCVAFLGLSLWLAFTILKPHLFKV